MDGWEDVPTENFFGQCSFTKEVLEQASNLVDGDYKWDGNSLQECWWKWHKDRAVRSHMSLPCMVIWEI